MRKVFGFIISLLLFNILALAQVKDNAILFMGGVAHLGNGKVINNSVIGIKDGKLSIVADATRVRLDTRGYDVVKIYGKHVHPRYTLNNLPIELVEGKTANLIVCDNDAFDMRTNKMLYVFINGECVQLVSDENY